jgi:hypothetical protein
MASFPQVTQTLKINPLMWGSITIYRHPPYTACTSGELGETITLQIVEVWVFPSEYNSLLYGALLFRLL